MPFGAFRLNTLARYIAQNVILNRYDNPITTTGDIVISTTDPKYGTGAASITSNGTIKSTIPFDAIPNNSNWTIEGWTFYSGANFSGYKDLVSFTNGSVRLRGFGNPSGLVEYLVTDQNGANSVNWNGSTPAWANGYFHWAVVHDSDRFIIYVNGVSVSNRGPTTANYTLFGTSTANNNLTVGGAFTGLQDEIRISKTARYTAAFTPPTAGFVNDVDTIVLYKCDGINGTTAFEDSFGGVILEYMELKFDTTLGSSGNNTVAVWLGGLTGTIEVDWGDGSTDNYTTTGNKTHTYATPGVYDVRIYGNLTRYGLDSGRTLGEKLTQVTRFNENTKNFSNAFFNCVNLTAVPTQLPANTTTLTGTFAGAFVFNHNISTWNTSAVTNMGGMFAGAGDFNQNISSWNVSNVAGMDLMFQNANSFNQNLSSWITGLTAQPSNFSFEANATFANNANNLKPFLSNGTTRINT